MVWTKITLQPQTIKKLIPFENDLVELIRNIKFRMIRNNFQERLKENIKLIKESNETITFKCIQNLR